MVIGRDIGSIVTIKYSRSGTKLWTRTTSLTPFNQNLVGAVAVDAANNIYVTGGVIGTMLTICYDPTGTQLWSRTTPAMGSGSDLALGPNGELYVAGAASGVGVDRSLIAKYDTAGTPLWVRTYPGTGTRRLAVDSRGDIVLVSAFNVSGGYSNWITQKITSAGTPVWSTSYDRHRYNDEIPYALAIGPDDEIYVTGQGGPGPTSGELSYLQTVTVRYSRQGLQEWAGTSFTSLRGLGLVQLSDNSIATVGESTFTLFHYVQSGVWHSVGHASVGSAGLPRLAGTGSPTGTAPVSLELTNALPQAPTWLVAGLSRIDAPFLGGVLVPAPDVILGMVTAAGGTLSIPFNWPGLPHGFDLTCQAWILDPGAPIGFAASNGIVGVSG